MKNLSSQFHKHYLQSTVKVSHIFQIPILMPYLIISFLTPVCLFNRVCDQLSNVISFCCLKAVIQRSKATYPTSTDASSRFLT